MRKIVRWIFLPIKMMSMIFLVMFIVFYVMSYLTMNIREFLLLRKPTLILKVEEKKRRKVKNKMNHD